MREIGDACSVRSNAQREAPTHNKHRQRAGTGAQYFSRREISLRLDEKHLAPLVALCSDKWRETKWTKR